MGRGLPENHPPPCKDPQGGSSSYEPLSSVTAWLPRGVTQVREKPPGRGGQQGQLGPHPLQQGPGRCLGAHRIGWAAREEYSAPLPSPSL